MQMKVFIVTEYTKTIVLYRAQFFMRMEILCTKEEGMTLITGMESYTGTIARNDMMVNGRMEEWQERWVWEQL